MNFSKGFLEEITALRKELHQAPELSNKEFKTTEKIIAFVKQSHPDEILTFRGKTGLAAVFHGCKPGKIVLFRADIDALPIIETTQFLNKSKVHGVSHKCGHDGHSAILAGLSRILMINPPEKGSVVLLFQPAEETGDGAKQILKDPTFSKIKPDYVFALHNLPGFPLNQIVVGNHCFASASKGMIVKLFGKTSHAAYPEKGISPALAMVETLPGDAQVMATLRSYRDDDMEKLTKLSVETITEISDRFGVAAKISWTDEFPATVNDPGCVETIRQVAEENGLSHKEIKQPFRWSEDFGHFTQNFRGAFFGIGAGESTPDLHQSDYDFRDEMIEAAIKMFDGIIRKKQF